MRRFTRSPRQMRAESDPAFCRHLQARPATAAGASGAYWCVRTLTADGPDGSPASPDDCTDERACFEAGTVEGRG